MKIDGKPYCYHIEIERADGVKTWTHVPDGEELDAYIAWRVQNGIEVKSIKISVVEVEG